MRRNIACREVKEPEEGGVTDKLGSRQELGRLTIQKFRENEKVLCIEVNSIRKEGANES